MTIDLDELERLAAAATPGRWAHDREWVDALNVLLPTEADAAFVAAARNALPDLIAEVRRLREAQERHLRLISELTKSEVSPADASDLRAQIAALIAGVGHVVVL